MILLKEAAAMLEVQPATLRQQIRNGKLFADKIGRDWHVSKSEVRRYSRESQHRELDDTILESSR
jgi:excisionase family DNA binding protein